MFDVGWCLMLDDDFDHGDDDDTSPISSHTTGKWKMTMPQQMPVAQSWQPYPRANNGHRPCCCPAFWVDVPLGTSRADREPVSSVMCSCLFSHVLLFQYIKTETLIPMLNYIWMHINISIVITSIDLPIRIPLLQKAMELFQRQGQKGRKLDVTTLRHWGSGAQVPLYITPELQASASGGAFKHF